MPSEATINIQKCSLHGLIPLICRKFSKDIIVRSHIRMRKKPVCLYTGLYGILEHSVTIYVYNHVITTFSSSYLHISRDIIRVVVCRAVEAQ